MCLEDEQCGAEGTCESTGLCSFPDVACESGQRYGGYAGSFSGECIPTADTSGSAGGTGTALATGTAGAESESTIGENLDEGSAGGLTSDATTSNATGGSDGGESTASASDSTTGTTGTPTTSGAGSSSSTGGDPPTCDELFGSVDGYQSCAQTDAACTFFVLSNNVSCDTICGDADRECLRAWNDGSSACDFDTEHACSANNFSEQICQCGLAPA